MLHEEDPMSVATLDPQTEDDAPSDAKKMCQGKTKSGRTCRRKPSKGYRGKLYCIGHYAKRIGITSTRGDKRRAARAADVLNDPDLTQEIVRRLFKRNGVFSAWSKLHAMYIKVCTEQKRPSALQEPMQEMIRAMNDLEFAS